MLRRDPTIITLLDTDVQEIRELTAHRGNEDSAGQASSVLPPPQPHVAPEEAKKKREAMTREQRLGLEGGAVFPHPYVRLFHDLDFSANTTIDRRMNRSAAAYC